MELTELMRLAWRRRREGADWLCRLSGEELCSLRSTAARCRGATMFSGHIHIRAGSRLTLTFDLQEAQAFCRCCCLSHHFLSPPLLLLLPPLPASVEADWLQHLCGGQRSWPWLVFVHLLQKVQVSAWSLVALCPRQQGEEVGGGGGL